MKFISRVNAVSFFESRNITKISNSGSKVLLILPMENIADTIVNSVKRFAKVITILAIYLEIVVTSANLLWNHLKNMRQLILRTILVLQISSSWSDLTLILQLKN